MADDPITVTVQVIRTFHAIARCASCEWAASLTGDTELEVAMFLHALLLSHVDTVHRQARLQ